MAKRERVPEIAQALLPSLVPNFFLLVSKSRLGSDEIAHAQGDRKVSLGVAALREATR